ncbi:MAG: acyl-CoA oxidase, partial [Bacteroidetes bacterium]
VAWADEVLSPTEMEMIQQKIKAQPWLAEAEKQQLAQWLDPAHAPSPQQLNQWLKYIRHTAAGMKLQKRQSLAELGLEMARLRAEGAPTPCTSPEACHALEEIETALGIIGHEASRQLLGQAEVERELQQLRASFSPEEMNHFLEPEQREMRNKVKHLLNDPAFELQQFTEMEAHREQVLRWCRQLAAQGWGALHYPQEQGGRDDMGAYMAVFETLGYHDLSLLVKFGVQFGLFGGSVLWLGTARHHRQYLAEVGKLELPGCFAMTEEGHGSNVRDIATTAHYEPQTQEFVIHTPDPSARKTYIGNAARDGRMATVFAQLYTGGEAYGVHAFLVPIRDAEGRPLPGITIEDCGLKLGLNGVDNGRISFEQVRIPRENLLNRFADVAPDGAYSSPIPSPSRRFFSMLGTLVGGRVCVPLAGLSASKKALNLAIRYAARRRQFGPEGAPESLLLDYQTHQRRLLIPLAKVYALQAALHELARRFLNRSEEDAREVEGLAAGLKAVSTWHTTATIQACREACGGAGYLAENQFAALRADTDVFTTFEGDNTVLLQLVAKGRLSAFKRQFHDMKFFDLLRYVSEQATVAITELNPLVVRNIDPAHLRDADFHAAAFQYWESVSLSAVARRLKKRIDQGMDSYDAFIDCQQHLLEMAQAYTECFVLTHFHQAIARQEEGPVKEVLQKLAALYALSTLEQQRGWFQEFGYLEGRKSKAIQREVNALCRELRQEAVALVEAFDIPARCLKAGMLQG